MNPYRRHEPQRECVFCGFEFDDESVFRQHLLEHHREQLADGKNDSHKCQRGCGEIVGQEEFTCPNGHDNAAWWLGDKYPFYFTREDTSKRGTFFWVEMKNWRD